MIQNNCFQTKHTAVSLSVTLCPIFPCITFTELNLYCEYFMYTLLKTNERKSIHIWGYCSTFLFKLLLFFIISTSVVLCKLFMYRGRIFTLYTSVKICTSFQLFVIIFLLFSKTQRVLLWVYPCVKFSHNTPNFLQKLICIVKSFYNKTIQFSSKYKNIINKNPYLCLSFFYFWFAKFSCVFPFCFLSWKMLETWYLR